MTDQARPDPDQAATTSWAPALGGTHFGIVTSSTFGLGNIFSGLAGSSGLGGLGLPSMIDDQNWQAFLQTISIDTIVGPVEIPRASPVSGKGILFDVSAAVSKAIGERLLGHK
jgi:hypothetical protein